MVRFSHILCINCIQEHLPLISMNGNTGQSSKWVPIAFQFMKKQGNIASEWILLTYTKPNVTHLQHQSAFYFVGFKAQVCVIVYK